MKKKLLGLTILLFVYVAAFAIGIVWFKLFEEKMHWILNLFIADVIATIFVWLMGVILKTASVYDPYWSIQTVLIYIPLMFKFNNFSFGAILFLILLLIYTIRLTGNFIVGFNDLSYIDWRYAMLRKKTGKFYQLVSLLGIHMVPTIVVFAASVPSFMYLEHGMDFSPLNLIGLLLILLGISLEFFADLNMKKFQKNRTSKSEIIRVGLWKYSRHPNYLGEIIIWYGVALVFILSSIGEWYYIAGAILNTLLFIFISIPMADNNLKTYKAGYDEYRKETRSLLPFPKLVNTKEKQQDVL